MPDTHAKTFDGRVAARVEAVTPTLPHVLKLANEFRDDLLDTYRKAFFEFKRYGLCKKEIRAVFEEADADVTEIYRATLSTDDEEARRMPAFKDPEKLTDEA